MIATLHAQPSSNILLDNISWETYETLLRDLEGERRFRITYDRGSLEIMTLSHEHEFSDELLNRYVHMLTFELDIPIHSGGSTTLRRRKRAKGLEPDKCYWIQNELLMRGKKMFDIEVDPPPDLAIEMEVTRSALNRMGIYAAIRVPEVWCYDGESLRVHVLGENGKYKESAKSLAFPFLPMKELERFLSKAGAQDETTLLRSFCKWVRETIAPALQTKSKNGRKSVK
ncbi:MAG TPA: Uma2 family endonuclease [Pirellulaceae bacterium]|nr:Uma2 family endonuclease [Pirellulaceae bacterium]